MILILLTYINRSGSTYFTNSLSKYNNVFSCPEAETLIYELLNNPFSRIRNKNNLKNKFALYFKKDKKLKFWGLTIDEIMIALRMLSREKLVGYDVCEMTPDYDVNGMGAQFCARTVVEILGGLAIRKKREE